MSLSGQEILSLPRKPSFATPAHSVLSIEAAVGIEPTYRGFADLRLTIWLRRHTTKALFDRVKELFG